METKTKKHNSPAPYKLTWEGNDYPYVFMYVYSMYDYDLLILLR